MAISNISPTQATILDRGLGVSFDIDDTWTTVLIKVQTATALVTAYSTALGGVQGGYSVTVTTAGSVDTFTLTPDTGWDQSPQLIYVIEDETGSSAQTDLSWNLSGTLTFPQSGNPYEITEGVLVTSVYGVSGDVTKAQTGQDQLDNTSDADKPVSTAQAAADALKLSLTGGALTGPVTTTSTFDGRDVSVDGAKLDTALQADASVEAEAVEFGTRPAKPNASAAGKGQLYAKDTGDGILTYVDAAGVEYDIMYPGGADGNAIHDNLANEITAVTLKTSIAADDELIMEDSAAAYVKKSVLGKSTFTFMAPFNGFVDTLPDSTNYYGPKRSITSVANAWPSDQYYNDSWGSGPSTLSTTQGFVCPVDCTVLAWTLACRFTDIATPQWETAYLVKFPYVNGFASGTPAIIDTQSLIGSVTSNVAYPYTYENASGGTFLAGDVVMVLVKNVSNPADFHIRSTVLFQAT